MPVQDPSFLTPNDIKYLQDHLTAYRQTIHKEKEAFRTRLTAHIMATRNLREDDAYAQICIYKVSAFPCPLLFCQLNTSLRLQKVTNWLSNTRQTKKVRLPKPSKTSCFRL